MSRLGRVASIFRYPVKTLQGESVDSIVVTELGFEGDRLWALRDEKRGDFGGGALGQWQERTKSEML